MFNVYFIYLSVYFIYISLSLLFAVNNMILIILFGNFMHI